MKINDLPTLYKKTNTGATQTWTIGYGEDGAGKGIVRSTFGQQDGKMQVTEDVIKEGKNIGRANATTPATQAKAEAEQKWEKKRKSGYTENIEQAKSGDKGLPSIDPMLAHSWDKQGKSMPFPCWVQPKLDGLRAICIIKDGRAQFYSRTRKAFNTIPHLVEQMEVMCKMSGITDGSFDGELYSHKFKDNFNEIVARVKRDDIHDDIKQIDYYIYDLPASKNVEFGDRSRMLKQIMDGAEVSGECPNLVRVETCWAKTFDELKWYFEQFLEQGYEGLMARDPESKYEGKRSKGLLKYKTMQDDEFEITGVQEGKGKLMGSAGSFVCVTKAGKTFNAKLKGEIKELKKYFDNFPDYKGKMLTVQYFNMTPDGLPRFPVGLRIREAE